MIMNLKYAERKQMYKNGIHYLFFMVLVSGCATTQENRMTANKTKITALHVMRDYDLCYGFFTVKDMDEWYAYENIRRVRRLDCEQHREEAQTQYQGKEINYDALNVTRLFKGDKEKEKKPILQDRALNEVCYIRINDLVFAKRGPESACQEK
tara:strand:+ start:1166 stop:1624 length:459 start_codon:yes stop_codon:yes gene_type:complete